MSGFTVPFPGFVKVQGQPFRLEQNTYGHVSEYDYSSDWSERIGARWSCDMAIQLRQDHERNALQSFLARLKGPVTPFWMGARQRNVISHNYTQRLDIRNHIREPWPYEDISDWTAVQNAELTANSSGWLEAWKTNPAGGGGANTVIFQVAWDATATSVGHWHTLSFYYDSGTAMQHETSPLTVRIIDDVGGELVAATNVGLGRNEIHFNLGNPNPQTGFIEFTLTGVEPQDTVVFLTGLVLARSFTVNGGGQTGNLLNIRNLYRQGTERMRAGDFVGIAGRLHQVRHDVRSLPGSAMGSARIFIDPPIYVAPANNTPVMIYEPAGLFRLPDPTVQWDDSAALPKQFLETYGRSSFAFSAVQEYSDLSEALTIHEVLEGETDPQEVPVT